MKLNRKWLLLVALVLSVTMATTGTLAYLTDRDSEANVFTMGNVEIDLTEDFEQGSELIPGVDIEKKPVITNTGDNDAWVWLTFSIPSALDNFVQGTETGSNENVIHWNPMGATTEGYVNGERVQNAFAAGLLTEDMFPAGVTNYTDYITANNMTWNVFDSLGEDKNAYQEKINGVDYNTYVLLYNKALEPGETTLPNIYKVFLDAQIDIDPEGNLSKVDAGVVTPIDWNIYEDGNPIIYASAYAIQTAGFDTVEEAYAAYTKQWGNNGSEYADPAPLANVEKKDPAEAGSSFEKTFGTISGVNLEELDCYYIFTTTETADEAKENPYRWYNADFVVSFDKDVPANTAGLAGNYANYGWLAFENVDTTIEAGEEIRLLESANISINYMELCESVKEFKCGAYDYNDALAGTTMTVKLCLYEVENADDPADAPGTHTVELDKDPIVIGEYKHTFKNNGNNFSDDATEIRQ